MWAMPLDRKPALAALVLVVVGSALYATNLQNPFFWDDHDIVVNNPDVQGSARRTCAGFSAVT